jgi:uncharacterized membrane protein
VLVKKITDKTVTYLHQKETTLTKEAFLQQYRNIVWVAESDENSGEKGYEQKLKLEKSAKHKTTAWIIGLIAVLLFAILTNLATASAYSFLAISLFKFIGTGIAILLLMYEIDKSNAFVRNICTAGGQTDCDAVLSSTASKIAGISWSEIGFFYFAGTTLSLFIPGVSYSEKVSWIAVANAFAAPYILFSLYYQYWVIKHWCPLCLAVQTVLFSEFIWSIFNFWESPRAFHFDPSYSIFIIPCVLLPILSWYLLKPIFAKAGDTDLYRSAYNRLQNNPDVFNGLLQQQARAADGWEHLGIEIGNPAAANTIIKVCSPYCQPCAQAHPILEDIIDHNKDIRLKIIFRTKKKQEDIELQVIKSLLAVAAGGDTAQTRQSLDDWYLPKEKDNLKFAAKYPFNGVLDYQNDKVSAMREWCEASEITYTPTIFVNGYRLPENYNLMDLKNIL